MNVYELGVEQQARLIATHRFEISYSDLSATAGTTKTLDLFAGIKAGTVISNVKFYVPTLFDGGATSDLTVQVGYDVATGTDDANGLLEATSIHADASYFKAGPVPIADVDSGTVDNTYGSEEAAVVTSLRTKLNSILQRGPRAFVETGTLQALFTSTGANLTALTQGKIYIFARISHLADAI